MPPVGAPVVISRGAPVVAPVQHHEPVPSAPTAEEMNEADRPLCVICMDHLYRSQNICALWCGHSFQQYCVNEWRVQASKLPTDCPHRCEANQEALRRGEMLGFKCFCAFGASCFGVF